MDRTRETAGASYSNDMHDFSDDKRVTCILLYANNLNRQKLAGTEWALSSPLPGQAARAVLFGVQ